MVERNQEAEPKLMDKEWESTQKRTFTHWINSHLRKVSTKIENIETDLRTGKNLCLLLEVISNDKIAKLERGNLRLHHVSNVNKCLDFIARKGVKLAGTGSEEIVDGNVKMTLGMVWTIILRFALHDVGDSSMSAKDGLLLWCQRKTEPYDNVNVKNFTTSWKDGLAFCALIHRHRPELIDYNSLSKENPDDNLELAFKVAEEHLDIPRMLEIEDMKQPIPDEKSVMTYVSSYYRAFATSHETEAAVKRLANALDLHKNIQKKINEYEEIASDLKKWIETTTPEIADRNNNLNDDLNTFKDLQNKFNQYKKDIKPKWTDEKNQLHNALQTIQTLHRINNLAAYVPPEELDIVSIEQLWKILEDEELSRLNWILDQLKRHRSIEHLLKKFNHKCLNMENFINENKDEFSKEIKSEEMSYLLALERNYDAFESDLKIRIKRVPQIKPIYDQLEQLKYQKIDELLTRYTKVQSDLNINKEKFTLYGNELKEKLEMAKKIDDLKMLFAKDSRVVQNFLDENIEEADDSFLVNSVADVENLILEHKNNYEAFLLMKENYDAVILIDTEIKTLTDSKNQYTRITVEQLEKSWNQLSQLFGVRESSMSKELEKQAFNEKLVASLNSKVDEVTKWQTNERKKINDISGSLEEQRDQLKLVMNEIKEFYEPKLMELRDLIKQVNDAHAEADSSSVLSLESGYQQLQAMVSNSLNVIENSIIIRDSSTITEEDMKEYNKLFKSLDKHELGFLSPDDFRNFLVALGYKVTNLDQNGEKDFNDIMIKVDSQNTKQVYLQSFLNYIAENTKNKSSAEDMIEAFKVLAQGKPYVTAEQIRRELPEHAEDCISQLQPYTGEGSIVGALDYMSFAAGMYGSSDL